MAISQGPFNRFQQLSSCRLVSTSNVSGVYYNGTSNNGVGATLSSASAAALTIDSTSVVVGDRILLPNQTNANENGIYYVQAAGSAAANWVLVRTDDCQAASNLAAGMYVPIEDGALSAGAIYRLIAPLPQIIGVYGGTGLSFVSNPENSRIISGTTGTYAGGGTSNAFTVTGLVAASTGAAVIRTSTNAVAIAKAVPSTNTLTITFSADPGAGTTVDYIYVAN